MLGLFVSFARSVKQWAWNNVALLVLTGLTYDLALIASDHIDTLQERHNALSRRVTGFEEKLNSLSQSPRLSLSLRPPGQAVASNIDEPAVADAVDEQY